MEEVEDAVRERDGLAGAAPLLAARLANVAGALVVRKPGTATVTADELAAELVGC